MNKAVFLDRDGTINEEVNYLKSPDNLRLIPGASAGLKMLKEAGYLNIIITNQSGIARGYFTEDTLSEIHLKLHKMLDESGKSPIDDIFYSPYHTDGIIEKYKVDSDDRKPKTGLVVKAKEKYDIDIESSFFIGDSYSDMKCAENIGLKKILVATGIGAETYKRCAGENLPLNYYAKDLLDAARFIKENYNN